MIVAAHQPHYLPWLGYLDKLAKADLFVVMDDLQYETQNFQNRQRVKLANGAAWLTVPLHAGSQADLIADKRIDNGGNAKQHWQRRHWLTLLSSYKRAPYFERYAGDVHRVYTRPWTSLLELDLEMLELARTWFHIKTPIIRSSSLGLTGHKTDRLIDLCKKTGARCYLTGRGGIGVIWQMFEHPRHEQRYGSFIPYLGFLDLLFNCGERARDVLFDRSHPMYAEAA
jgi:hypothetical protein